MRISYDILNQGPLLELLKREDLSINLDYENGNLAVALFHCKQDGTDELLAAKVIEIPIDNH